MAMITTSFDSIEKFDFHIIVNFEFRDGS